MSKDAKIAGANSFNMSEMAEFWKYIAHEGADDLKTGVCAECEIEMQWSLLVDDLCEACSKKEQV